MALSGVRRLDGLEEGSLRFRGLWRELDGLKERSLRFRRLWRELDGLEERSLRFLLGLLRRRLIHRGMDHTILG